LLLLLGVSFAGSSFAFATPAYVQGAASATYASAQTAGNLNVVAVFVTPRTATISAVVDSAGNTYTLASGILTGSSGPSSYRTDVYYAKNIAASAANANTITVVGSGVTSSNVMTAEYSGIDTANPFDGGAGHNVSADSETGETGAGPWTTTNNNDLLIGVFQASLLGAFQGSGAGYTARLGATTRRFLEDSVVTSNGTYFAGAFTTPGTAAAAIIVAFKAAISGDTQAPTAPTNVLVSPVSSAQMSVSWTASTDNVGVTGYLVERCQGAGCSTFTQVGTTTGVFIYDSGLATATSYTYRVRAQDASSNLSAYSATVSATTSSTPDTQAPTTPSNLVATAVSGTQINLTWSGSFDNLSVPTYRVERCQGAGCSTFTQVGTPTSPGFTDTGLSPSTSYTYRVRALDGVPNLSAYSATASATTQAAADPQPPTAPTNLTATPASTTQINLSWTASTDNVAVTGYRVERCQGTGCSTYTQVGTPTGTTFNDVGLTAATSYTYRVRAQDAVPNLSLYSGAASATTQGGTDTQAPTAPTNLSATAASNTQINLSWTASTDNVAVTGYRVERCQGAGCSTFTQVGTPIGTTFNDTGLSASTSYTYRVRAQDAVPNLSAYSATATAMTSAQGGGDTQAPTVPGSLTAVAASNVQIDLSWVASTDNVGVTAYVVERCLVSNCSYSAIRTLAGTKYSDLTVSGSTAYSYRVRAKDAANNFSAYSSTANATAAGGVSSLITSYTYDNAGRLRTVTNSGNSTAYTLDAAGNRKQVVTDAAAGSLQLQQATYSVAEAGGTVNIPVSRSVADGGAVSVQYSTANGSAVAPDDYTVTSGTLSWPDGDATPKTITIPVASDTLLEGNETFTVSISSPAGGAVLGSLTQATVTILDDDGIGLAVASVSVNENDPSGSATVTITKSGPSAVNNSVSYATSNGSAVAGVDYTAVSNTLTFAPSDTTKTFTVPIVNDGAYKGNRSFTVSLSNATNGATIVAATATVTIVEDDAQPVFAINSLALPEGSGFSFTVIRTGSLAATNSVNFATSNGSAAAGTHYLANSGTLTFNPSVSSLTIPVTSINDGLYNNDLTFSVGLSSPTNLAVIGTGAGTGTIQNTTAAPVFTLAGPAGGGVVEGGALNYGITMTGASALTHTINYTTADGTAVQPGDYSARSGTLAFSGSTSTQTISVPTLQEGTAEAVENLSFAISSPTNGAGISGSSSVTSIIVDADSPPPVPTLVRNPARVDPGANFALSWTTTLGDTHYIVLRNSSPTGGTFTPIPQSPVTGSGIVLFQPSSGDYRFQVQACRGSQCSGVSNTVTVLVCLVNNC